MPLTCPSPQPDCPLYSQRVDHYSPTETLRRLILTERRTVPSLADLVRLEGEHSSSSPPALLPAPLPTSEPVFKPIKRGADHE